MAFIALSLLFLLRVVVEWLSLGGWSSIILDLAALTTVIVTVQPGQFIRLMKEWSFLKERSHHFVKRKLTLDIITSIAKITSLFFLALWFSRWILGFSEIWANPPLLQDLTYIDVFVFGQVFALLLDTGKIRYSLVYLQMTTGRQILFQYGLAILISTPLLLMPFSLKFGQSLSLIDSIFIVVSALSVTGLSPIEIGQTFSMFGLSIILILIQLGGLGIILVVVGFSFATFSRLSMNSILMGQEMYGSNAGDVPAFLGRVVGLTILIEFLGAVLLYFCLPSDQSDRMFSAVFHSVAAFCNSGFSTFTNSLGGSPFGVIGLSIISILIVLGGLGFPIMLDIISLFKKDRKEFRYLSAYTRLTIIVMFLLITLGSVLFFILESVRPDVQTSWFERIGYSIFYSISSRTAGFGIVDTSSFYISTIFLMIILMSIGTNPTSTGSGIKTTTVGILFMAVLRSIQGHSQVIFQGRAIPPMIVSRALAVTALFFTTASIAVTLLIITEEATVLELTFEVISALSTTGHSMGITSSLTVFGKVIIIFLMLFGRIGILAVLLASMGHLNSKKLKYPEDEFFVG